MRDPEISFTAVFFQTGGGYVGFVEELPGVNSSARTLDEARSALRELATVIFEEERRQTKALLEGKDVVREQILLAVRPNRAK